MRQSRLFVPLDNYSRTKYQCFLAEMSLVERRGEYLLCFRPMDPEHSGMERYACCYVRIGEAELKAAEASCMLPASITDRIDQALSELLHQRSDG